MLALILDEKKFIVIKHKFDLIMMLILNNNKQIGIVFSFFKIKILLRKKFVLKKSLQKLNSTQFIISCFFRIKTYL